jgi:hypothetical protein
MNNIVRYDDIINLQVFQNIKIGKINKKIYGLMGSDGWLSPSVWIKLQKKSQNADDKIETKIFDFKNFDLRTSKFVIYPKLKFYFMKKLSTSIKQFFNKLNSIDNSLSTLLDFNTNKIIYQNKNINKSILFLMNLHKKVSELTEIDTDNDKLNEIKNSLVKIKTLIFEYQNEESENNDLIAFKRGKPLLYYETCCLKHEISGYFVSLSMSKKKFTEDLKVTLKKNISPRCYLKLESNFKYKNSDSFVFDNDYLSIISTFNKMYLKYNSIPKQIISHKQYEYIYRININTENDLYNIHPCEFSSISNLKTQFRIILYKRQHYNKDIITNGDLIRIKISKINEYVYSGINILSDNFNNDVITKKENNENKSFESIWQIGTKNKDNQEIFNKQIVSSDIAYVYFKHFLKNKDLTVENNILILNDNYENFDEFKNEGKDLNSFNDLDKIKKLTLKEKLININETKINKKLNQNIETIRMEHTKRDLLNELGFQKLNFINSEFTNLNKLNYYTDNNSLKNNNSCDTLNESYDNSESNSSKSELNNNFNITKEDKINLINKSSSIINKNPELNKLNNFYNFVNFSENNIFSLFPLNNKMINDENSFNFVIKNNNINLVAIKISKYSEFNNIIDNIEEDISINSNSSKSINDWEGELEMNKKMNHFEINNIILKMKNFISLNSKYENKEFFCIEKINQLEITTLYFIKSSLIYLFNIRDKIYYNKIELNTILKFCKKINFIKNYILNFKIDSLTP